MDLSILSVESCSLHSNLLIGWPSMIQVPSKNPKLAILDAKNKHNQMHNSIGSSPPSCQKITFLGLGQKWYCSKHLFYYNRPSSEWGCLFRWLESWETSSTITVQFRYHIYHAYSFLLSGYLYAMCLYFHPRILTSYSLTIFNRKPVL